MRMYLDNCCFNRPFDDQGQIRVILETEAKLEVQKRITAGEYELVWSYILDYENQANPFEERRMAIQEWKRKAVKDVVETEAVLSEAQRILKKGIRSKDALHVSCAVAAGCEYFLTTDDLLLDVLKGYGRIHVVNPVDFIVRHGQ